jgi:hypothetical protein
MLTDLMGVMAARWHGTTHSRSSLAHSMAGQVVVAKDQRFEATTHTFNSDCFSAADEADSAALGRPALASQDELRDELSDLISGRCETRLGRWGRFGGHGLCRTYHGTRVAY